MPGTPKNIHNVRFLMNPAIQPVVFDRTNFEKKTRNKKLEYHVKTFHVKNIKWGMPASS